MIYAVIDTNVLVSALLTHNPNAATARVLDYIAKGDSTQCRDEAYGKKGHSVNSVN